MEDSNIIYYNKPLPENSDFSTSDVKANVKLRSLLLLFFVVPVWVMVLLMLVDGDTFFWGCLFLIVAILLTYVLIKKTRNDIKLKKGELYFKVSHIGIEYTAMNEMSGGVIQYCLLWSDIVTSPRRGYNSDVHFLNNGYKNNTKNIVIYASRQSGVVKEILIPIHNIKIFRNYWEIYRSILINIALLQYPILTIDEEVFYYFNVNPETFRFRKKCIRRRFSDVFIIGGSLITGILLVVGGVHLDGVLNVDFKYLIIPSIIGGITVSFFMAISLAQYVSFFRNSYPKFTQIAYREDNNLSIGADLYQVVNELGTPES